MPNAPIDTDVGAPNPLAYTVDGDGTVTDRVTGLVWQQVAPTATYAWTGALAYCPTLNLAGDTDWRLPTVIELASLVDDSIVPPAATIEPTAFPGAPAQWFWSATPTAGAPSNAWYVSFDNGQNTTADKTSLLYVRCVRGGP